MHCKANFLALQNKAVYRVTNTLKGADFLNTCVNQYQKWQSHPLQFAEVYFITEHIRKVLIPI